MRKCVLQMRLRSGCVAMSPNSAVLKDDAMPAFGVAPRDGTSFVAHHVAGTAFKALLVVKQDAAIVGGDKELRWTRPNASLGGAALANLSFDRDVRLVRHPKVNGFHAIVEAQRY
jgi:hypothetical protein